MEDPRVEGHRVEDLQVEDPGTMPEDAWRWILHLRQRIRKLELLAKAPM